MEAPSFFYVLVYEKQQKKNIFGILFRIQFFNVETHLKNKFSKLTFFSLHFMNVFEGCCREMLMKQ